MQTEVETAIHREAIAARVERHPFLAGIDRDQLVLLTDGAMGAHFNKGQVILKEGEEADRFYLIESGKVILESKKAYGPPVIIDTVGAGDLLGWSWMFPPYQWQFTARAVELTSALFFYGTILRDYCETDHSLGYELLKRMTTIVIRRMQGARRMMLDLHSGGITLRPVPVQPPAAE
jgi:CRP/FNR family transcriptional regulator, cyclic AMP receptor protein